MKRVPVRLWLSLLTVVFVCRPADSGAAGGEDDDPVFGLGWQDGVTLHWRCVGPWFLEGAAGPDDLLIESTSTQWDPAVPLEDDGKPEVLADDKREMGWVRLAVGRRVWRRGDLDLQLVGGLRYLWENTQNRARGWDSDVNEYWSRASQLSEDSWSFYLAARPVWRAHPRVSLGFDLGFAFSWSHLYEKTITRLPGPGGEETLIDNLRGKERSFETWGGWDGMAAVHFMFWF